LPPRVYQRRGKLYYSNPEKGGQWDPLPEGLKSWAKIVEAQTPATTLSILFARYDLKVLPRKSKKSGRNRRQEWSALELVFGAVHPDDVEPHHVWSYRRERSETEGTKHEIHCLSAL